MPLFEVRNSVDEATILLYDAIGVDWMGEGVTAKRFIDQLDALGKVPVLNLHINSPGGVISDGMAIYNALVRHPARVNIHIDGLAASTAGWIAMAGDEINMAENALFMMHNAQAMCMGDKNEMTKAAGVLDKHDETIALTFARRTNRKADTFAKMMADETWFSAKDALAAKLIDKITPAKKDSNRINLAKMPFKNSPKWPEDRTPGDEAEVERRARMIRARLVEIEA